MDISFNRKPYYFTPENNRVLDIKEQAVLNYIFSLPNRAEFEAVMEEELKPELKAEEPKVEEEKRKPGRPKKGEN
jgi:hypothetical protein